MVADMPKLANVGGAVLVHRVERRIFAVVFVAIRKLMAVAELSRRRIGF